MYPKKPNPIAESGVKHQKSINQSTKCTPRYRQNQIDLTLNVIG